jgi:hypothetical protein
MPKNPQLRADPIIPWGSNKGLSQPELNAFKASFASITTEITALTDRVTTIETTLLALKIIGNWDFVANDNNYPTTNPEGGSLRANDTFYVSEGTTEPLPDSQTYNEGDYMEYQADTTWKKIAKTSVDVKYAEVSGNEIEITNFTFPNNRYNIVQSAGLTNPTVDMNFQSSDENRFVYIVNNTDTDYTIQVDNADNTIDGEPAFGDDGEAAPKPIGYTLSAGSYVAFRVGTTDLSSATAA